VNRNPKAFYQQIKKSNKTQSLKAMRSKLLQKSAASQQQRPKQAKQPLDQLTTSIQLTDHICGMTSSLCSCPTSTKDPHPTATHAEKAPNTISNHTLHKQLEIESTTTEPEHTTLRLSQEQKQNLADFVWTRSQSSQLIMEQRGPIIHIKCANMAAERQGPFATDTRGI